MFHDTKGSRDSIATTAQPDTLQIRLKMGARLPAWAQPGLTWVTGHALPGQRPLWRQTPQSQLAIGLVLALGGLVTTLLLLHLSWHWSPLVVLSVSVTVSGARFGQTNLLHQIAHGHFCGRPRLDRLVGHGLSMLLLLPPLDQYAAAHIVHHSEVGTLNDPDFAVLRLLGLEAGSPTKVLVRRLILALVNPRTHLTFFRTRVLDHLRHGVLRALVFLLVQGALVATVVHAGGLTGWVLGCGLPWVLFNVSAILQVLTEHVWLCEHEDEAPSAHRRHLTVGRFMGEMPPEGDAISSPVEWAGWWLRLLTVHLGARVLVVQGPLPGHDEHHANAMSDEWPNAIFLREANRERRVYLGVWGLRAAIDLSLRSISEARRANPTDTVDAAERDRLFRGM